MMQTEEKVKTTTASGRKRAHLVKFFLNDEEYEKLCKDAATCNSYLPKPSVPPDTERETKRSVCTLSTLLLSAWCNTKVYPGKSRSICCFEG